MWNLKKQTKKWTNITKWNNLIDTENKLVIARGKGGGEVDEIGEGDWEVHIQVIKYLSHGNITYDIRNIISKSGIILHDENDY